MVRMTRIGERVRDEILRTVEETIAIVWLVRASLGRG